MKASNVNILLIVVMLLSCSGCKNEAVEAKAKAGLDKESNLIELKTDLPLAKNDRSINTRQRIGEPLLVPKGTKLLSSGAEVISSEGRPILGELKMITDGNERPGPAGYNVELLGGQQWIQLDLGKPKSIHAILVWHYYLPDTNDDYFIQGEDGYLGRVYQDVVIKISNDPSFEKEMITVFNNDHDNSAGFGKGEDATYVETSEGLWVAVKGVMGRYVRLYSSGHIRLERGVEKEPAAEFGYLKSNDYIEVEIYGK